MSKYGLSMSFTSDILFFMRKGEGERKSKKKIQKEKKGDTEECKKDCERQSKKESHRVREIERDTKKVKEKRE